MIREAIVLLQEAWAFMGATGALLAWAVAGTLRDRR